MKRSGPAKPSVVWERYMDTALWSTWAPQIRAVESSTPRLEVGTHGTVFGPLAVRVSFEVLAVDEATRTWSWHAWVGARSIGMHLDHGVVDSVRGSETSLTVDALAPFVLGYAPVAKLALGRLVA